MSEPKYGLIHTGYETGSSKGSALDCFHDTTNFKYIDETKYRIVLHKEKEITDDFDESQGLRDWEWYIEVFATIVEKFEWDEDGERI